MTKAISAFSLVDCQREPDIAGLTPQSVLHAQEKIVAIIQSAIKCYRYSFRDKGLG
jgi:hypothetical protein